MIDTSQPTSKHTWLAAVLAALISAPFVGLNAVASKLLFSPAAPAHFDAVSLFVARGFWSLPLFLVLALATMPHALLIWFDFELVLLLSLVGQLLQGVALRTLNVALVVALTSYGSITAGLAASIILLGEHLTVGEIVAGLLLVTALGLSLVPISAPSRIIHASR